MILLKKSSQLSEQVLRLQTAGLKTGFVPTMGALHNGHLSLLKASKQNNDITVCSIFVNPTQFNNASDFKKYPVTLENDILVLEQAGTDILFLPGVHEIYPNGTTQSQPYGLGYLESSLEGKYRPGHFQGVCQVMNRLLDIVQPHQLYMGRKDYQQCMVVKKLLHIMRSDTILNTCPTQREPDGLAMSSRNMRLNAEERKNAVTIFNVLQLLKNTLQPGCLDDAITTGKQMLEQNHFTVDYVAITDATTLEPVTHWDGSQALIVLIAAFMHEVRLIDNMIITGP